MFLDKSLNKPLNLESLMNESYEYLIEYQNAIHELNMKMIKCEHTCIVNEDSNMMMLAEEEYKNNVQAAVKAIWNKIAITIENFIITIRKLINNIKQKFLIKKDIKEKLKKITELYNTDGTSFTVSPKFKDKKYEDGYSNGQEDVSKLNTGNLRLTEWDIDVILNNDAYDREIKKVFSELTSGDNDAAKKALEMFDSFSPNKKPDTGNAIYYRTKGFSKLIINAYETMQKAPKWIELLERCRNDAKKKARLIGSEDVKSTADATYYQRTINKGIMHIQKIMNACFKILYTLEKIDFTDNTEKVKREREEKEKETQRTNRSEQQKLVISVQGNLDYIENLIYRKLHGFKDKELLNKFEREYKILKDNYEKIDINDLEKLRNLKPKILRLKEEIQNIYDDALNKTYDDVSKQQEKNRKDLEDLLKDFEK